MKLTPLLKIYKKGVAGFVQDLFWKAVFVTTIVAADNSIDRNLAGHPKIIVGSAQRRLSPSDETKIVWD